MRKTLRCPKCDGGKILAVDAIQDKSQLKRGGVLAIDSPMRVWGEWQNAGACPTAPERAYFMNDTRVPAPLARARS